MRQELKDDATFKEIYYFSFSFGLSENQKSLRMWHDRLVNCFSMTHLLLVCWHFLPWPWLTLACPLSSFTPESLWNSFGCCYSILDALVARSLPKTGDVVRFRPEQVRPLHIEGHLAVGEFFPFVVAPMRVRRSMSNERLCMNEVLTLCILHIFFFM